MDARNENLSIDPASDLASGLTPGRQSSRLMTAKDVAVRWGVSEALVYRLAREGRIPMVGLGRRYRFRLASIEAWEADQERSTLVVDRVSGPSRTR